MIRFFHDGSDFEHRYELYDLAENVGETRNLAHARPEKVETLDARIEAHLEATDAARPVPNPNYDPESTDLLVEGGDLRVVVGTDLGRRHRFDVLVGFLEDVSGIDAVCEVRRHGVARWGRLDVRPEFDLVGVEQVAVLLGSREWGSWGGP